MAPTDWTPDPAGIYFSDYFGVHPDRLEEYGALDISVVSDLPLFVDPFLAFNSDKPEYQALHEQILDYLRFLRDKAGTGLSEGAIRNLYAFKEVKQNWLGYTVDGNAGRGPGPMFAKALHGALGDVLGNLGSESITESSHLEKVALIQERVGKDNISDFATNLTKHFLLTFTQTFAEQFVRPEQLRKVNVPKALFNYNTQTWATLPYTLPWLEPTIDSAGRPRRGDYVILSPLDLLTKDDTWINRSDMLDRFDQIALALPDDQLRAQVDEYLSRRITEDISEKELLAARAATLAAFPELVDYYIALKEADCESAAAVSLEKTKDTQRVLRDQVQRAAFDLAEKTAFFDKPWTSYEEAVEAVSVFKHYVEHQDGYRVINRGGGDPFASEPEVQRFFGLLLQRSRFDVNSETNNGRGPVDFKLSSGAFDKTLIEFKLGKSSSLKRNLKKQVEIYEKANKTDKSVKVVINYTAADETKVQSAFEQVDQEMGLAAGTTSHRVVVIDARADSKPSASTA